MHKKYEILFCIYFQSFDFVVLLLWFWKRNSCTGKPPTTAPCIFRKPAALSGRQGVDFNWATTVKTRYGNTVCSMNLGHTPILIQTYLLTFSFTFTLYLSILQQSCSLIYLPDPFHDFFLPWMSRMETITAVVFQRFTLIGLLNDAAIGLQVFCQWSGVILWHQPKRGTIMTEISGIYIPYSCIKFDPPAKLGNLW